MNPAWGQSSIRSVLAANVAKGKTLRESVPRSVHAKWRTPANRPGIVAYLEQSNQGRLPALIPLRHARMLNSTLACFRGSAGLMAADLAGLPTTNLRIQIGGDCHLNNFGWFASPERNLLFDLTDFDETRNAPWEWDLKRLIVSAVLAGRQISASKADQRNLVELIVREYRDRLAGYITLSPLEMWYQRLDADAFLQNAVNAEAARRTLDAARRRTVETKLPQMIEIVDGTTRFRDQAPVVFHTTDDDRFLKDIRSILTSYRATLSDERRMLLDRYEFVDAAYKIVGVGSVGLRCGIVLMQAPDADPLVLQIKEARASVLENYVGPSERLHHGHRIVHGQRLMQAASDLFLGWANDPSGLSYYVRQLRDMKLSLNVGKMSLSEMQGYARLCGWALARAHAKAGDCSVIFGYLGSGEQFAEALAEFGLAYASQAERDHDDMEKAAKAGQIGIIREKDLDFKDLD